MDSTWSFPRILFSTATASITTSRPSITTVACLLNLGGLNTSHREHQVGRAGWRWRPIAPGPSTSSRNWLPRARVTDVPQATITVPGSGSGGKAENDKTINTGSTSGLITINYNMYTQPDTLAVYYPPGTLLMDFGSLSGSGGGSRCPIRAASTKIQIVVNKGGNPKGTSWTVHRLDYPDDQPWWQHRTSSVRSAPSTSRGPGTYTGLVDVVSRRAFALQDDTARLGAPESRHDR